MQGSEAMQELLNRIEANLAREQAIANQLKCTREKLDMRALAAVEEFPRNGAGEVQWHVAADVENLKMRIARFVDYDAMFGGGRASAKWPGYLEVAFPWMAGWTLEKMVTALVVRCWYHRMCGTASLDYVEFFCGHANLSRAAIEQGMTGVSLDKCANPLHNVLEGHGLRLFLLALTATKEGALEWVGCPCNSFVVLCRAQSQRTPCDMHLGDESKYFVLEGNTLGDLSAMLLFLGYLLCLVECLEQPANSVLPESACAKATLRYIQAERTITYHICFGGATLKPLQLWSGDPFIRALERERPDVGAADGGLVHRDDEGAFTGDKELLKESQQYSKQFGQAVIRAYLARPPSRLLVWNSFVKLDAAMNHCGEDRSTYAHVLSKRILLTDLHVKSAQPISSKITVWLSSQLKFIDVAVSADCMMSPGRWCGGQNLRDRLWCWGPIVSSVVCASGLIFFSQLSFCYDHFGTRNLRSCEVFLRKPFLASGAHPRDK